MSGVETCCIIPAHRHTFFFFRTVTKITVEKIHYCLCSWQQTYHCQLPSHLFFCETKYSCYICSSEIDEVQLHLKYITFLFVKLTKYSLVHVFV